MSFIRASSSVENIVNFYNAFDYYADSRVKTWYLMNSLLLPLTIIIAYLYFVLKIGPRFMQDRKPCQIKNFIIFYNILQVFFNIYIFKRGITYLWDNLHSIKCLRMENPIYESSIPVRYTVWLYMVNKFMDLLDTVFFVLRKKQSHVTFLHVYHHVVVYAGSWGLAKYYPGGQILIIGVLNSFVHVIMYSYYLLSLSDRFRRISQFLKKRITQIQITQFVIALAHGIYGSTDSTCELPQPLLYFGISQGLLFLVLFGNFYRKAYLDKSQKKVARAHINASIGNGKCTKGE